jgi:hypothetical protein
MSELKPQPMVDEQARKRARAWLGSILRDGKYASSRETARDEELRREAWERQRREEQEEAARLREEEAGRAREENERLARDIRARVLGAKAELEGDA